MANYLTVNSMFRPYSYEELLKGPMMATEYHRSIENEFNDYETKAAQIRARLVETRDAGLINDFDAWNNDVDSIVDALASKGISGVDRATMLRAKRDFNNKLAIAVPAIEARDKAITAYNNMLKDSSIKTSVNPYTLGVSDYMNGNIPQILSISGKEVMNEAMLMAQAMSKRKIENDRVVLDPNMQDQYYRITSRMGYSKKEADEFLQSENFEELKDRILFKHGADWLQGADKDEIEEYIKQGFELGLTGTQDTKYQVNHGFSKSSRENGDRGKDKPPTIIDTQNEQVPYQFKGPFYRDLVKFQDYLKPFDIPVNGVFNNRLEVAEEIKRRKEHIKGRQELKDKYNIDFNTSELAEYLNNFTGYRVTGTFPKPELIINDKKIEYSVKQEYNTPIYNPPFYVPANQIEITDQSLSEKDRNRYTDIINKSYLRSKADYATFYKKYGTLDIPNHVIKDLTKKLELSPNASMYEIEEALRNSPESKLQNRVAFNLTKSGDLGKDMRNTLGASLLSTIISMSDVNFDLEKGELERDNIYIRPLDSNYREEDKAIKKFSDIFTVSEDGTYIDNITDFIGIPELIAEGKIAVVAQKGNTRYRVSVPLNLFGNNFELLNNIYEGKSSYINSIKEYLDLGYRDKSNEIIDAAFDAIAQKINESYYHTPSSKTDNTNRFK